MLSRVLTWIDFQLCIAKGRRGWERPWIFLWKFWRHKLQVTLVRMPNALDIDLQTRSLDWALIDSAVEFLLFLTSLSTLSSLLRLLLSACFRILHDNIVDNHSCVECKKIKGAKRLSEALVHFVTARGVYVQKKRLSGLPIRARYKYFKTICEYLFDNSPTDSSSSSLKLRSSKQGVETLCNCSVFLFASSQHLSTHFFAFPSISYDHANFFAWGFSHSNNFSSAPAEIRDSTMALFWSIILSFGVPSRWVHPKYTWSRDDVGSPRSTSFINFFHLGLTFCFLPAI